MDPLDESKSCDRSGPRAGMKSAMQKEWLGNEQHQAEQEPDENHGMHPPEAGD
jgi:hypothetical protein